MRVLQGEDLRFDLQLEFREAIFGCEKDILIQHLEACQACRRQGVQRGFKDWLKDVQPTICNQCNGDGGITVRKNLKITIPAGVDDLTRLRITQEGDAGKFGGSCGDLYVYLFVNEDQELEREGCNILSEITITQDQALTGCQLEITTVDGAAKITIPSKTQHNAVVTVQNHGVPQLGSPSHRGKHLVTVKLKRPQDNQDHLFNQAIMDKAQEKLSNGDGESALTILNNAIKLDPVNAEVYCLRGEIHHHLGGIENDDTCAPTLNPGYAHWCAAIKDYTCALRINPEYAHAFYCRAYTKDTLSHYISAIQDYTYALQIDSNYAPAYYRRGRVHFQQRDYKKAVEDFNQAIRVSFEWGDVDPCEVYTCRGIAHSALENYEKAGEDFNFALKINPNDAFAYENQASNYVLLGDNQAGVECYGKAADLYLHQGKNDDHQRILHILEKLQLS